jgi:hypothetical protein
VENRSAYRLVSGSIENRSDRIQDRVEFLVDSETYLPLAQRNWTRYRSGRTLRGFVT